VEKAVFLDRDGVLNEERGDYTWRLEDFRVLPDVRESLDLLKKRGFRLIVITNQAGISRGIYTISDYQECHKRLQQEVNGLIDDDFYSIYHPEITASLSRKPDSLLFERALAKWKISPSDSWMVGDKIRDLIPAEKLGIKTLMINQGSGKENTGYRLVTNLLQAAQEICKYENI